MSYWGGKWKLLKPYVKDNRVGYLIVNLCCNGKSKKCRLHRLVWEAFNGPIPEGMHVNHINEDPKDNRLCNLNLLTPKENNAWGTHKQREVATKSKQYRVLQFTLDGEFVKQWESPVDVERNAGYNSSCISNCCRGVTHCKSAYGYVWKYAKYCPSL